MSTTCKYCNGPENKQDRPGLICKICTSFVHLTCLRRPGTPGDFACDVFFEFTCEDCSPDKREVFTRNKFPWVNVILLTLYHLTTQSYGISNHGFFHYKTHICSFIDRNWNVLFGAYTKQKKNWVGTIAGALSVYNNLVFKSGSMELRETGWWKLQHAFSPALAAHIVQEMAKDKPRGKPRNQLAHDKHIFTVKVTQMGFKDLINNESDILPVMDVEHVPGKKRRLTSDYVGGVLGSPQYDQFYTNCSNEATDDCTLDASLPGLPHRHDSYSEVDNIFNEFQFATTHVPPSDSSSIHSFQHSAVNYDSDTRSNSSNNPPMETQSDENDDRTLIDTKKSVSDAKTKKSSDDKPIIRRENLFSALPNSIDLPWVEKIPEPSKDLVEISQYEEIQLLKQVESMIPKVKDPNKKAYLYRLKAKLALRRLKRHKHLPIFDFDKSVRVLGGYVTEDPRVVINSERVLDRFQTSYLIENLCGTIASTNYGTILVSHLDATPFVSTYSGALLKPYIRRDRDSEPTWLKLMQELLVKTNRKVKDYKPPALATIDYSYVRPQHIAAVNNLCAQFFWPGIDLTEALQYPEFSCVVTYKKLVVGCAFLVPDVRPNEAYISFILTRPEWRNASIASFMLYHLLQTCTGKDVTLHVSPTNPAIFLYQKFGFKVEELIQDFYEKYYDMDYKGCRHALFLRLVR